MDIVVCIPKDRLADVHKEEADVAAAKLRGQHMDYFWSMGRKPRHLNSGDRCFFAWDGAVRALHRVLGFGENMTCKTTGRIYTGFALLLDSSVVPLPEPIPIKSFRGFQYWPL